MRQVIISHFNAQCNVHQLLLGRTNEKDEIEEMRDFYKILVEKSEGVPGVNERTILKWSFAE
jgi:hypothetical protein